MKWEVFFPAQNKQAASGFKKFKEETPFQIIVLQNKTCAFNSWFWWKKKRVSIVIILSWICHTDIYGSSDRQSNTSL